MSKKKSLEWLSCSEAELSVHIKNWIKTVDLRNSVIFLEGDMGAGKSTFARALLAELAPMQKSMGSPTFSLVHEYTALAGYKIYHIDLYRLKNEAELHDSGIETQIDEPGSTALVEWGSLFEESFMHWFGPGRRKSVYRITITNRGRSEVRDVRVDSF